MDDWKRKSKKGYLKLDLEKVFYYVDLAFLDTILDEASGKKLKDVDDGLHF